MKNKIILVLCFIGLLVFIFLSKDPKINPFVEKTKKDIEKLETEKEELFDWADKTMEEVELEKQKSKKVLHELDSTIKNDIKKLELSKLSIKKNRIINDSLVKENREYTKQKEFLEALLTEAQKTLSEKVNLLLTLEENHLILEERHLILEERYGYLNSIYQDSRFIVVDTVYQIDTVFYQQNEIKKIVIKN